MAYDIKSAIADLDEMAYSRNMEDASYQISKLKKKNKKLKRRVRELEDELDRLRSSGKR